MPTRIFLLRLGVTMDWLTMRQLDWQYGANNERTDVRPTIEDRLRNTGVLSAIRRAALEDTEHHYGQAQTSQGSNGVTNAEEGDNVFRSDV